MESHATKDQHAQRVMRKKALVSKLSREGAMGLRVGNKTEVTNH